MTWPTAPEGQLRKLNGQRALFRVYIDSAEGERNGLVMYDVKGDDTRHAYSVALHGETERRGFLVRGTLRIIQQRNDIVGADDEFRVSEG